MLVSHGTGLAVLGASGSGNSSRENPSVASPFPVASCVGPFLVVIVVRFCWGRRHTPRASLIGSGIGGEFPSTRDGRCPPPRDEVRAGAGRGLRHSSLVLR